MAGDDWEEKMLDQLERLLSNMGMNMSREQLRALLQQFRAQFEKMGIDEERIAKGDVNLNFDLSNLQNFFQPGMDLSLIHISEPTRRRGISYAVFCLKKKRK